MERSRARGRWPSRPEESPGSTGQGAGDEPGRGDPAEGPQKRDRHLKGGKGEKVV